jgi:serine/threonine protein kinase
VPRSPNVLLAFGPFRLDLRAGELLKNGLKTRLPEQSFQVLTMLLENAGGVITRDEIRRRLWPNGTVVEFDHSINAAVQKLRQVLGDSAEKPTYIETLGRRGYRWMVPVQGSKLPLGPGLTPSTPPVETPSASLVGKRVSHYRVLEVLGGGGMGLIYKAEDLKLGRRVALKFLPEELSNDSIALERFEREARAASALNHPNICTIFAIEEHAGQPFLVMELLEGETLRESISSGRFPPTEKSAPAHLEAFFDIAIQIAGGLDAAHRKGIIHRDVKPANIFLTTPGQVKILDFGLAKLHGSDLQEEPVSAGPRTSAGWNPNLSLTRTGTTLGTAGYMSPEQIRGEKLDPRTDLFSFGMVLYEMATGQRAFTGDTAPVLREAILSRTPQPPRELNAGISAALEKIISKALQKNRELRYENASEMRTELEVLKRATPARNPALRRMLGTAAVSGLMILVAFFWLAHTPTLSQGPSEVKLTQLTDNSAENPVRGGTISPDGKYLAYIDLQGMHIKLVGSDEAQSVPLPAESNNPYVAWRIGPWFPDSKRFLAHSHPDPESINGDAWLSAATSVWVVSVLGGPPQKLRDNSYAWDVSPASSNIAFGTNFTTKGPHHAIETWLMSADGQNVRQLFPSGPVCCLHFSEDGRRVSYGYGAEIRASDLAGGSVTTLVSSAESQKIGEGVLLPDGRYLYFDQCKNRALMRSDTACNFWITRVDLKHGGLIEKPRKLTNWFGLAASNPNMTSDGKRVVFRQWSAKSLGYLADLDVRGTRVLASRRFPMQEGGEDSITSWTADGKSAIVSLNRFDHYSIRMQALNSETQSPIVTSALGGLLEESAVSPDGKWLILLVFPVTSDPIADTNAQLMRVPITGGIPELIFTMRQGSSVFCARLPSTSCAVAEESLDRRTMIVTSFDPAAGRGAELARFDLSRQENVDPLMDNRFLDNLLPCDISPDGTRLAAIRGNDGPIEIHSLRGQAGFMIPGTKLHKIKEIRWTADGKGLIVSTGAEYERQVVHVDFRGNTDVLWKCYRACYGIPSPDGRHLGIATRSANANMWMMENF